MNSIRMHDQGVHAGIKKNPLLLKEINTNSIVRNRLQGRSRFGGYIAWPVHKTETAQQQSRPSQA